MYGVYKALNKKDIIIEGFYNGSLYGRFINGSWIASSLPVYWEKEVLFGPVDCYSIDIVHPGTDIFATFVVAHFDRSFDFATKSSAGKYLENFNKLLNSFHAYKWYYTYNIMVNCDPKWASKDLRTFRHF
jgi:hypothetical protein